jgi:fructoselysine-6-P-deglycase FrlB-like protein
MKLREVCWKLKHVEALSVDELPHGRLFSLGDKETIFFLLNDSIPEYFEKIKTNIEFFKIEENLLSPITCQQIFYLFTELMCKHFGIDPDNPRNVEIIKKILNK